MIPFLQNAQWPLPDLPSLGSQLYTDSDDEERMQAFAHLFTSIRFGQM